MGRFIFIEQIQDDSPNHEKVEADEQTQHSPTVSHERFEGKCLHFSLDPDRAGGEDYGEKCYIRKWNINRWKAIAELKLNVVKRSTDQHNCEEPDTGNIHRVGDSQFSSECRSVPVRLCSCTRQKT